MKLPLRPEVADAFAAALELAEIEQEAFLARAYPQDQELRAEVLSLLATARRAGSFLDTRNVSPGGTEVSDTPPLPSHIGRYRILRRLGEGGMGAVYEAEQDQPCRTVALKVIKTAVASPEFRRRFERESQVLGRLQHPGIAQVYEAGTADTGFGAQPYFAMELIRGTSLLEYAAALRLPANQRLDLMIRICDAVQHAHQRGIIHRDLKPGNILVDSSGQPKVLDFGVARLAGSDDAVAPGTSLGQLVGTLAYMSPEQVLADPLEIDTRSDVYSLGIILFELLAGRPPYQIGRQLPEAVKTIRETDPAPLGSFNPACRGDLETITAKALEKEKGRRYSSAAELAADLTRYLRDEPILARRSSALYRARKFARRHRALVAGAAAVFAVLVAGIVVSVSEAARARTAGDAALRERDRAAAAEQTANRQRDRALAAEQAATADRNRAVAEKQRADTESAAARAINRFLQEDLLAQASPNVQARPDNKPDPDLKVRTALDRAAAHMPGRFDQQPEVEASLRQTIGDTYLALGLYPEAQSQFVRTLELRRRLLGEDHPDTLVTMNDLADLYQRQGKFAQAEALFAKVLEKRKQVLGAQHPGTLLSMSNLGYLYLDQGRYADAEPLFTKAVELQRKVLGEENPDTLISMSSLAVLYRNQGKLALAEPLFLRLVAVKRRVLGDEHPETLTSMNNLAVDYWDQGKRALAEPLYLQVLETRRRVLGEEHPNTLNSMNNLAALYRTEGRFAEAEALVTKVLAVRRRVLGNEHRETLNSMSNLARLYHEQNQDAQALPLFSDVLEVRRRVLGPDHPDTLTSMNSLAVVYSSQGQAAPAEALFTKALETRRRALGPRHPDTADTMSGLAQLYLNQGRPAPAEPLLREALSIEQQRAPDSWVCFERQSLLGAALAGLDRFGDAESLLVSGYEGLRRRRSQIPLNGLVALQQAADRLVRLYQNWGKEQLVAQWTEQRRQDLAVPTH